MLYLTKQQIEEVEKEFRNFLWGGKKAKIALFTLQKNKLQGGLRLVDLSAKQDTLRIKYIFSLYNNTFLLSQMSVTLHKELGMLIWRCNIKPQDVVKYFSQEIIWGQMMLAWSKIHYKQISSKKAVKEQIIWFNSDLKIEGQLLNWKHWIRDILCQ